MSYFHINSFIFLIPLIILIQNPRTIEAVNPLYHKCLTTAGEFTPNTRDEINLNSLLWFLHRDLNPSGFSLAAYGFSPATRLYGMALCRVDLNPTDCNTCVVDAGTEIRKRCPYNKGAVIWYDNCSLKYLDKLFVGQVDYNDRFVLSNVKNTSFDPSWFNQNVKVLLSYLADLGAKNSERYAIAEMKLDTTTNLYGLTQCTQDLSSKDCKSCLEEALSWLTYCCDGKQGGRLVGASCNFRYELYPFLKGLDRILI